MTPSLLSCISLPSYLLCCSIFCKFQIVISCFCIAHSDFAIMLKHYLKSFTFNWKNICKTRNILKLRMSFWNYFHSHWNLQSYKMIHWKPWIELSFCVLMDVLLWEYKEIIIYKLNKCTSTFNLIFIRKGQKILWLFSSCCSLACSTPSCDRKPLITSGSRFSCLFL